MGKRTGQHREKALTATRVRALKEPGRYPDGNGLYLQVEPSGSKWWLLRTVVHGRRRDIGLGGLATVSLASAREKAAEMRKTARAGGDPLAERRLEQRKVPTFEEAARHVHKEHSPSWRNPAHRKQWITTLEEYAFPDFGSRRVDHIESGDVLRALGAIWTEKPETARRVRQRIRTVFDWAKAAGHRSGDNPVEGVTQVLPRHKTKQEHFSALPYEKVPEFIRQLRESAAGPSVRLAFEFLILTAARTSEVLNAEWSEFDLTAKTWTIPADRMKAGREHRVPLSPRCIEILKKAKDLADDGKIIFPGRTPKTAMSNMTLHMTLRRMERSDCTPHGFRSSFRDWSEEKTNFPRTVTEAALAHVVRDKTEAAYRRTDLFNRRRKLMEAWAAFATAKQGKVVKMRA